MSVHLKDHFINLPQLLLYLLYCVSFSLCYQNASVSIWHRVSPKKLNRQSLAQRKVYCRDTRGEWVARAFKSWTPRGFQQNIFKGKVREGCGWLLQTSWCGVLCFCSCPCRFRSWCSCKPPRYMLFSVLQFFFYPCMNRQVLYLYR